MSSTRPSCARIVPPIFLVQENRQGLHSGRVRDRQCCETKVWPQDSTGLDRTRHQCCQQQVRRSAGNGNISEVQAYWVEGVGFPSHYSKNDSVVGADFFNNFRHYTTKHMGVAITELDVMNSTADPTVSKQQQQQQVGIYTNVISACKQ